MNIGRGKRNTRKVPYAEASAGSVKLLSFHKGGQMPAQITIYGVNKMTKEELKTAIKDILVKDSEVIVEGHVCRDCSQLRADIANYMSHNNVSRSLSVAYNSLDFFYSPSFGYTTTDLLVFYAVLEIEQD